MSYRHADEISIMRLVGATEGTLRGPFLVAVAVPGVVAGALSVVGTTVAVKGLSLMTTALGLSPISLPVPVLAMQLIGGASLPVLVAAITLSRHSVDAIEG